MSKQYVDPQIDGWMMDQELNWLFQEAKQMENVVEIGSWKGKSAHALLSGCPGTVYCVDHFKGSPSQLNEVHKEALTTDIHAIFLKNVGHFKNLKVLKMDSVEASKLFGPKSVDMIFIDGEHLYKDFSADLEAWFPKCRKLFCGHDIYTPDVNDALRDFNIPYRFHNPTWTLWSVQL